MMHRHHIRALQVIAIAVVWDTALGLLFSAADHIPVADGLYFSVTTATTVGYGDITPRGAFAHLLAIGMMLTVIPLVSATFALITSGLASTDVKAHIDNRHNELKKHITDRTS